MQNYAGNIITGLEKNWNKNEEAQLDFIVEELKTVPAEQHEEVMYRCAAYMTLSRTAKVTDWFAEAEAEEAAADARFVAMNERDWREAQQQAKRQRWFGTWDRWVTWARRVDGKRLVKATAARVVKKEVDKVAMLLEERRDVQRYPNSYGPAEYCESLIADYEQMICAIPAGKWRLALVKQNESKALQPRVDEIVRQVKLTMALKETLAAKRIQTAWRSHATDDEESVDYDDGNQPPRALHGVARHTHDDGFADDYDGEDEDEEETRRQEMVETRERQEEAVIEQLLEERLDVFRHPERHATNQAETVALLCELENSIVRHGGKARLDKVIAAEEEEEEKAAAAAEDARREAEYSQYPGLAAFIKMCGEPCKMTMDPEIGR